MLAGCFGTNGRIGHLPTVVLRMTAVDEAALTASVFEGTAHPDLLDRIVDGGATTENSGMTGHPPLPDDEHVLHDGTVYRLSRERIDRTPAHLYRVDILLPQDDEDWSGAETVRVADLPAVDREKLADFEPGVGTSFVYTDAERQQSVLVPDPGPLVLVWDDGTRGKWTIREERETAVTEYRYTADRVASASEYGKRVRERFGFELTGLSAAERTVVETAIAEDRYVLAHDETPSAAVVSLVERVRAHDPVHELDGDDSSRGEYLAEYDDTLYLTELRTPNDEFPTETPA